MSVSHKAKKHFGQNFLHDGNIIRKIIQVLNLTATDNVIEIGPGLGALTQAVLPIVKHLHVVELDADVIPHLQQACQGLGELTIHHTDALQFDITQINLSPLRVIGNLPYNISSPLLFHLVEYAKDIKDMHFMLQKEVVERMAAVPSTNDYGRLSVMLQYHCQVKHLFNVPPGAFRPAPKVDSAFVRLIPHAQLPYPVTDYQLFTNIVKAAFAQRRKTIRNSLKPYFTAEQMQALNIDPQARAENLTVADFATLSNSLCSLD
jgi:16S rRNA (adenine1518-N6/adenine1519-N6)-dimethyltransferase